jgi:hypothetical protein
MDVAVEEKAKVGKNLEEEKQAKLGKSAFLPHR